MFSGAPDSDVAKFFFFFDYVVAKGANDSEKATQLLPCLTRKAFDFYYETYAYQGHRIQDAYGYAAVKQVMNGEFSEVVIEEDYVRRAMDCKLGPLDMSASLTVKEVSFKKAKFNDESKFALLTNAVF